MSNVVEAANPLPLTVEDLQDSFVPRSSTKQGQLLNMSAVSFSSESEYDCPLFSNSPYTDVLSAIKKVQSAVQTLPDCVGNELKKNTVQMAATLQEQIENAKSMKDSGDQSKFEKSVGQVLKNSDALINAFILIKDQISAPGSGCYKDTTPQVSSQGIFAVNQAFQSMAPLALDFVAKNPGLSSIIEPFLPQLAGAKAISNGLSLLELVISDFNKDFDLSKSDNRINIIQNTCSFMKLYRKSELLMSDRANRMSAITSDFESRIQSARVRKENLIMSTGIVEAVNMQDTYVDSAKKDLKKVSTELSARLSVYQKSDDAGVVSNKLDGAGVNLPVGIKNLIEQCLAVSDLVKSKTADRLNGTLAKLAWAYNIDGSGVQANEISVFKSKRFVLDKLSISTLSSVPKKEISVKTTEKELQLCARSGKDWMQAQVEVIDASFTLIKFYDSKLKIKDSESKTPVQDKIKKEDEKISNLEENKEKFDYFAKLARNAASAEFEKSYHRIPRFLFNGPDKFQIGSYSIKTSNGPVYELIKNTEAYFDEFSRRFSKNIMFLKKFEIKKFHEIEYYGMSPEILMADNKYLNEQIDSLQTLKHVSLQYLDKSSLEYQNICDAMNLAKRNYISMIDQLLSNASMCQMIYPVLKEEDVSPKLKSYCRPTEKNVFYSVISSGKNFENMPGYLKKTEAVLVKGGPRDLFGVVMAKLKELGCEESGNEKPVKK